MRSSSHNSKCLIARIHKPQAIEYNALSDELYLSVIERLEKTSKEHTSLKRPREFRPSDLDKEISPLLRSGKNQIVFIEYLGKNLDSVRYDDVCQGLAFGIENIGSNRPRILGVCVSNPRAFQKSVILERKLLPACDKKKLPLVLVSVGANVEVQVLCCGEKIKGDSHFFLGVESTKSEPGERLTEEELISQFHMIFGHFEVGKENDRFHLPILASSAALARNPTFLGQIREDSIARLGTGSFRILPLGIPGGGIEVVALAMAEGDDRRLVDDSNLRPNQDTALLILCDIASEALQISRHIKHAKESGYQKVLVIGIGGFENSKVVEGAEVLVYLKTEFRAICVGKGEECPYCAQAVNEETAEKNPQNGRDGDTVIIGEYFEDFAMKLGRYDPFVFWEFLHQNRNFVDVGHWEAKRTDNHYLFTIHAEPIFRRFGFDISLRFRNLLVGKGILPTWVNKVFCADDNELIPLAETFASVLGLSKQDVVRIPRVLRDPVTKRETYDLKHSVVGREMDAELQRFLTKRYHKSSLTGQNVVIIDQAAHHFRTLSSLKQICETFDCHVFAFLVFVDRTEFGFSLGEYLPDSHYLSLYSWPVPPKRKHECPCGWKQQP